MAFLHWGSAVQSAHDRILLQHMLNMDRLRLAHGATVCGAEIHFPGQRLVVYAVLVRGWGVRLCYN